MRRLSSRLGVLMAGVAMVALLARCSRPGERIHPSQQTVSPRIVIGGSPLEDSSPIREADAPPELVAVRISSDVIHSGDTLMGWVVTSSNVASAEIRVDGYALSLIRDSIGHFSLARQVPHIPSFAKGNYTLIITAHNSAGKSVQTSLPIHIR